jgi:hypothetical protein
VKLPLKVVAVVTMGGVADARNAVVLSHHYGMVAARVRAAKERARGCDAIAEYVEDFIAAGGVVSP